MVCLLISAPICQGTIKHVMQQCGGRAHNVDIVLVAQISIFTQTMGTGGLAGCVWWWGGETSEQKKRKRFFTILIRVTKTLNDFLPN